MTTAEATTTTVFHTCAACGVVDEPGDDNLGIEMVNGVPYCMECAERTGAFCDECTMECTQVVEAPLSPTYVESLCCGAEVAGNQRLTLPYDGGVEELTLGECDDRER